MKKGKLHKEQEAVLKGKEIVDSTCSFIAPKKLIKRVARRKLRRENKLIRGDLE